MQIKRSNLAACAAIIVAGMGISYAARGQIVVNGTYDPSFGAPLAVAQVPTSAGDSTGGAANQGYASGSELDATYCTIQNNTLYLFFAGNLSTPNQDNLDIFIQTGTGGVNMLANQSLGGASPGGYQRLAILGNNRGLQFDNGFAPNYFLTAGAPGGSSSDTNNGNFNSYVNYANLNTGANGYLGYGNPGAPGVYNTNQVGNALGMSYGFNNSNTGGVTGTTVGSPASVTTGFEFSIPLADITEAGQTISTVEVTAFIADQHQDNVYNQLTGLSPGYPDLNGQTTLNNTSLGDPTYAAGTNFNNDTPGSHSVTIANIPGSAWRLTTSGDWNNSADWANGVIPNATGAQANFLGTITSPHTVYSDAPVTVGTMTFNNANSYVIAGAGSLTLQASSGSALISVQQGSHTIQLPTIFASNTILNVASGSTLNLTNAVTINSGAAVTQTGTGSVKYSNIVTLLSGSSVAFGGKTTANTLNVANTAVASVAGTGSVLTLNNLGIAPGGTLNIGTGKVIVNYGSGADPIASIAALLASGYQSGAWTGTGITSSAAQANSGSFALGYADAADPGNPAGLPAGEVEIVYTLLGDANLDGAVNGSDFAIMASNFNKADLAGHSGWDEGDFNYDGATNGADFASLAANFNKGTTLPSDTAALDSFAAADGLLASVPEPATLGLLALGGVIVLSRRRRSI